MVERLERESVEADAHRSKTKQAWFAPVGTLASQLPDPTCKAVVDQYHLMRRGDEGSDYKFCSAVDPYQPKDAIIPNKSHRKEAACLLLPLQTRRFLYIWTPNSWGKTPRRKSDLVLATLCEAWRDVACGKPCIWEV